MQIDCEFVHNLRDATSASIFLGRAGLTGQLLYTFPSIANTYVDEKLTLLLFLLILPLCCYYNYLYYLCHHDCLL